MGAKRSRWKPAENVEVLRGKSGDGWERAHSWTEPGWVLLFACVTWLHLMEL